VELKTGQKNLLLLKIIDIRVDLLLDLFDEPFFRGTADTGVNKC